jgi:hypothetical protein
MRSLSGPTIAAASAEKVPLVQLVLMEFPSGNIALNTSTWDLTWDNVVYKGAYGLGQISPIDDSPGEIKGLQLELAGVSTAYIALALDSSDEVQGTPLTIRTAILDSDYQIVDAPVEWTGTLDVMAIQEDGETAAISASAESTAVDLLRGAPMTYSDADQQSLFPGDRAFEYVVGQADQPIVWPAKEWFYR